MRRARTAGFTLIEVVLAMVLLGVMMVLLYSGLSFAMRAWDAGDANGRRTAERRLGENFLRRELAELFPMRWKDPMQVKLAFEGKPDSMRFVSSRPAGLALGGLALVSLELERGGASRAGDLVMRRAMPDDAATTFAPLERGERHILIAGVERVGFSYFGSENDFSEPQWHDTWSFEARVPQLVRLRMRAADGSALPELVARVVLGEEAGCLENSFQRLCRPRRPGP